MGETSSARLPRSSIGGRRIRIMALTRGSWGLFQLRPLRFRPDQTKLNPSPSQQRSQEKAQLTAVLTQTPGPQKFSRDCWIGAFCAETFQSWKLPASISIFLDPDEVQTVTSSHKWLLKAAAKPSGFWEACWSNTLPGPQKGDLCHGTGKTTTDYQSSAGQSITGPVGWESTKCTGGENNRSDTIIHPHFPWKEQNINEKEGLFIAQLTCLFFTHISAPFEMCALEAGMWWTRRAAGCGSGGWNVSSLRGASRLRSYLVVKTIRWNMTICLESAVFRKAMANVSLLPICQEITVWKRIHMSQRTRQNIKWFAVCL